MVRAALGPPRGQIGRGPSPFASYLPAGTVVAASLLAALPIVSGSGWFPDFGYLVFISWRLLRADPWPPWWAAPLGFINDLFTDRGVPRSVRSRLPVVTAGGRVAWVAGVAVSDEFRLLEESTEVAVITARPATPRPSRP